MTTRQFRKPLPVSRKSARAQRGQTLLGLIVVIAILGIISATLYHNMVGRNEYNAAGQVQGEATPIDSANDAVCTEYMSQVAQAANMYRQTNNTPPPDLKALKPYGVTDEMANTPNCNFGIPKDASQPQSAAGVTTVQTAPQVSWQQTQQPQQTQSTQPAQPAQGTQPSGVDAASQAARDGIPMSGGQ